MKTAMVKVYGYLRPCPQSAMPQLLAALRLMGGEAADALTLEGDLLNVGYEGVFFPVEDFLQALAPLLDTASAGKLDYMDMEAWTLTRYSFENGFITSASRPLNHVLDHSGH